MNPREITMDDLDRFGGRMMTFAPPPGMDACTSIDVMSAEDDDGFPVLRLPFKPTAEELADLAGGGTVWLSIWGRGMPPVSLGVQPVSPAGDTA